MNTKPKLKICFCDFWPGFPEKDNMWDTFLLKHYDVEHTAKDPDVVVFGPFGINHFKFSKKKCLKLFASPENFMEHRYDAFRKELGWAPVKEHSHFSITSFDDGSKENLRVPCFVNRLGFDQLEDVDKRSSFKKTKGIVYMAKNCVPFRDQVVQQLQRFVHIDCAGKCLKNMEVDVPPGPQHKLEFIKDYKFVIGIENSMTPGYVTEKLVEPWLVDAIPIYIGDPEVAKDFDESTFINATHFGTVEDIFEKIKEIHHDDALYESMITRRKVINKALFNEDRLLKFFKGVVGK